jgi:hypothetical protein
MKISIEQGREAFRRIIKGPRPYQTLKVWHAVMLTTEFNTVDVRVYPIELAKMTGVPPNEVSRAMSQLARDGLLERVKVGAYRINPHIAYSGTQAAQKAAQERAPHLKLVPTPA